MQKLNVKINLSKIDKDALFKGEKGIYLDAVIFLNDEDDQYGNRGSIIQSFPKDKRPEKPIYIGNVKILQYQSEELTEEDKNDLPWD